MLSYNEEEQTYKLGLKLVRMAHSAWLQSSLAPVAVPFIDELSAKYDMVAEEKATRELLDTLYGEAVKVGFDVQYKKDYFPRKVKDVDGFMEFILGHEEGPVFERAIREKETELGRYLEIGEKAELVNR